MKYLNMKTKKLTNEDILEMINLYKSNVSSTHKLGEIYKIDHKKVSQILKSHGVEINKRGGQNKNIQSKEIGKTKTLKYQSSSGNKIMVARCKQTQKEFSDINNLSGALTEHILGLYGDIKIPKNNYQRKKYEKEFGKKWFEEYFDIIEIEKKKVRKCKLCDWTTTDISNQTGCFEIHVKEKHKITIKEYLEQFPEDLYLHPTFIKKEKEKQFLKNNENFVVCKLCGKKMRMITNTHLKNVHQISKTEYKLMFPNEKSVSNKTSKKLSETAELTNINQTPTWESSGEIEIKEFIKELGFITEKSKNRKLLNGKEIDIIIPELKIAIEYNGLYFHTEKMGKTPTYHLNKTIECLELGYKLFHIFEDEWVLKKDIIKNKLKHILKVNNGIKIGARKVVINKITPEQKSIFLNDNHIQGNDSSTIHYGAFYNNTMVGVMTFNEQRNMTKSVEGEYELSRYAVHQNYIIPGLASKMLKHFINEYKPPKIISFADRRWTPDSTNNLYTHIGFKISDIIKPRYFYYNSKIDRYKRFHKFVFGKTGLRKKYPDLDFTKSEKELTTELGFERIWDCGLIKYELIP